MTLVRQLADALAAAHHAGIIHRRLPEAPKTSCTTPPPSGLACSIFGIARDAELPPEERLTRTGFFVGTLQYVAPEALSGELVDGRADIYSLATIAYFLLTGRHPYTGKSPRELFQQLLTQPPVALNQAVPGMRFSAGLEAAIMRGLAREPGARQPTVEALATELEQGLIGDPTPPPSKGLFSALKSIVGRK